MRNYHDRAEALIGRGGSRNIGSNILRLPIVSRVYLDNFSVLADQHGLQAVHNLPVLLL